MKSVKLIIVITYLSLSNSAPAGVFDFIGDLLSGKVHIGGGDIKLISPADYFAPSEDPPAPKYNAPSYKAPKYESTTSTSAPSPAKLFEPSYNPPAPSYDVPPPPDSYDAPLYDAPSPPNA